MKLKLQRCHCSLLVLMPLLSSYLAGISMSCILGIPTGYSSDSNSIHVKGIFRSDSSETEIKIFFSKENILFENNEMFIFYMPGSICSRIFMFLDRFKACRFGLHGEVLLLCMEFFVF